MTWARRRPKPDGNAAAQGYGGDHKKLRATLLPKAYGTRCYRCGKPMLRGQALHLDHLDNRTGYGGFSHAACNLKAAARKARRIQVAGKRRRLTVLDDSRQW